MILWIKNHFIKIGERTDINPKIRSVVSDLKQQNLLFSTLSHVPTIELFGDKIQSLVKHRLTQVSMKNYNTLQSYGNCFSDQIMGSYPTTNFMGKDKGMKKIYYYSTDIFHWPLACQSFNGAEIYSRRQNDMRCIYKNARILMGSR